MSNVETYYLIDFENVNNAGLICSRHLDYHDHIHIFSTKNAPKISIEILSNFHSVDYSFHCLSACRQAGSGYASYCLLRLPAWHQW